ncbi:MAG: hypothetical protein CM15mP103_01140 [Gammaproteobacteria bacterium]|nr:MAG: hypothetical protein CM15mP103_01140 [Gammaproteobacteria bacterium]
MAPLIAHPNRRRWSPDSSRAPALAELKTEGFSPAVMRALKTMRWWKTVSSPLKQLANPISATARQCGAAVAIDQIVAAAETFSVHLLYGVTGSGKPRSICRVLPTVSTGAGRHWCCCPRSR